nr:class I SAM-dependent methyltransferase [Paenibacillus algorifonticola]
MHDHVQSHFTFDGHTVLDFGSGTGANCSMFHPLYYVGIDPDAKRIDYAKRLYTHHAFQVLESKRFPFDNDSFDYILIIAVLHHVSSDEISSYMKEFQRILKPNGTIIVMEPCLCKKKPICNRFMKWYDNGEYIRNEEEYIRLFIDHNYDCNVINRFRKCFLYHELFFSVKPKSL